MKLLRGGICVAAFAAAADAMAHGFGARYDLPLPLALYLAGAGLAVALSFAVLSVVFRFAQPAGDDDRPATVHRLPLLLTFTRAAGVSAYLLVLVAGFFGAQDPFKNIAPVMVWAIWWVGTAFVAALVANVWPLVNPLDALFVWAEAAVAKLGVGRMQGRRLPYPQRLDIWPAVFLFVAFVWMEIAWDASDVPASLARALLAYSVLTWLGMALFGRQQWLARGEAFTAVFGVLGAFAPIHLRVEGDRIALRWRPHGRGLLVRAPIGRPAVLLVMVLMSAVSFDGFVETPAWAALAEHFASPALLKSAGIVLAPLLFLGVFLLVARCSAAMAHRASIASPRRPAWKLAGLFARTLVPIAIAYQLSHYVSFLVMGGQYAIMLASDPMGRGWNLFGSAQYFVRPGLVDARQLWNLSVAVIVVGHIAAIYLAHVQALREFSDSRVARVSQYPMIILMIGYTMLSLWIIAQPIVSTRAS